MTATYRAYKFFHYVEDAVNGAKALLYEGASSGVGPSRTIDLASKLLGIGLLENSTEYLAGVDLAAFKGQPQRWGASMVDAFKPFEAGLRSRYQSRLRISTSYADANLNADAVTFGSPNSNMLARDIYGVDVDSEDHFVPRHDAPGVGLTFENPSTELVQRTAGFSESSRLIRLADGRELIPVVKNGVLADDYLVVSCVSHPRTHIENARRLDGEILEYEEKLAAGLLSKDTYEDYKALKEMREAIKINRILCIGGIYGPGTGAAGLLFSNPALIADLQAATDGMRTFHAVYHIPKIRVAKMDGRMRELPAEITRMPIAILPAD